MRYCILFVAAKDLIFPNAHASFFFTSLEPIAQEDNIDPKDDKKKSD